MLTQVCWNNRCRPSVCLFYPFSLDFFVKPPVFHYHASRKYTCINILPFRPSSYSFFRVPLTANFTWESLIFMMCTRDCRGFVMLPLILTCRFMINHLFPSFIFIATATIITFFHPHLHLRLFTPLRRFFKSRSLSFFQRARRVVETCKSFPELFEDWLVLPNEFADC